MVGGTGVAFYNRRFFSFRQLDGQVFDLYNATTTNSFVVNEDGLLEGEPVFPPYSKEILRGADDITLSGKEIYFVDGSGGDSHIGLMDKPNDARIKVCDLAAEGWGQMYVGIAASPRNQSVADVNVSGAATFFLKTDSGDFLTAVVMTGGGTRQCVVVKDSNLQRIEYSRTFGMDRTIDEPPIFYY